MRAAPQYGVGYARVTKQPAVCLVSAGGGATNIVTAGLAQAYKEAVPLFVISSYIGTASVRQSPLGLVALHGTCAFVSADHQTERRLGRVED